MRARCVGVHPPGVAWLQKQKSGGVVMVMRVGNCAIDAIAAHRRRTLVATVMRDDDGDARRRWRNRGDGEMTAPRLV